MNMQKQFCRIVGIALAVLFGTNVQVARADVSSVQVDKAWTIEASPGDASFHYVSSDMYDMTVDSGLQDEYSYDLTSCPSWITGVWAGDLSKVSWLELTTDSTTALTRGKKNVVRGRSGKGNDFAMAFTCAANTGAVRTYTFTMTRKILRPDGGDYSDRRWTYTFKITQKAGAAAGSGEPGWKAEAQPDTIIGYYTVADAVTQAAVETDGSLLAAFAEDGTCRGVAAIGQGPKGKLFQITIGIASSNDKNISFRVWDAATGAAADVNEGIASVAGIEKVGSIAAPVTLSFGTKPEVKYTVTFDLGEHGKRTGGGELSQQVESGKAATAPRFDVAEGWKFTGWDKAFGSVTSEMTVKALYEAVRVQAAPEWKAEAQPDTIIGYYTVADAVTQAAIEAEGSLLAAFAEDGTCRGVAAIGEGPKGKLFQITVGIASSNDKNISFKVWDAATGETCDINEVIASVAGIEKVGSIAAPVTLSFGTKPEVKYTVTFDLGEHGTRTGGGELEQQVESGKSATEPTVTAVTGWKFKGWDKPLDNVRADLSVTAGYEAVQYKISYQELKGAANANPETYTVEDEVVFAALTNVEGFTFKGWSPAAIAKGTTGDLVAKALWEKVVKPDQDDDQKDGSRKVMGELVSIDAATFSATTYDGYLYEEETGVLGGTIQVKAAKAKYNKKTGKTTTKLTVGIQLAAETKKLSISGEYDIEAGGEQTFRSKDGRSLKLLLGANGLTGSFDGYALEAVANVYLLKDAASKVTASVADAVYVGTYNIFAEEGSLSVSVAKKGKVKVAGTLSDGTKVSASAQLLVGEGVACAPFVLAKQGLAFAVWLGEETAVAGLTDAIVGSGADILGQNAFYVDVDELSDAVTTAGVKPLSDFMPYGVSIVWDGRKWTVGHGDKAGKINYEASSDYAWDEKSSENPAGLSLSYSSKSGTFTGSFKVYGIVGGKLKTYTAKVAGVLVDGQGYGYATIAKMGSAKIRIYSEAQTVPTAARDPAFGAGGTVVENMAELRAALDAGASTIYLRNGRYNIQSRLYFGKSVALIGESRENTVFDGRGWYESICALKNAETHVSIRSCALTARMYIEDGCQVVMSDCDLAPVGHSTSLLCSGDCTLTNCCLTAGVAAWSGGHVAMDSVAVNSHGTPLYASGEGTSITARNCSLSSNYAYTYASAYNNSTIELYGCTVSGTLQKTYADGTSTIVESAAE